MNTVLVHQIKVSEADRLDANSGKSVPVITLLRDLMCFGAEKWTSSNFDYFSPVAEISSDSDNALEDAFMIMQRVDENHTPENNPAVTDLTGNHSYHSLSVGDIVEVDGSYFMVEGIGFKEIEVINLEKPDWYAISNGMVNVQTLR